MFELFSWHLLKVMYIYILEPLKLYFIHCILFHSEVQLVDTHLIKVNCHGDRCAQSSTKFGVSSFCSKIDPSSGSAATVYITFSSRAHLHITIICFP